MAQTSTRKDQSLKIFHRIETKNPGAKENRAKVIAELVAKVGMTPGGASTYFANAKNGKWAFVAKPVTKPATKPVVKAVAKPVTKPAVKATTKPAVKATTKPATKPVTKPATKPAAEATKVVAATA